MITIRDAYLMGREHLAAAGIAEPVIEAEVLLRHALGVDRAALYTRWDGPMPEAAWERYRTLLAARATGRPVHYLLGEREFMGLAFAVNERVMIPRPETEVLVEFLIKTFRDHPQPVVVDVGTGSGCIAISLAHFLPRVQVYAVDISAATLEVARANARRHGVEERIAFAEGDLLAALPKDLAGQVDAIASNPPYVPEALALQLLREIRDHEPAIAIFASGDGMGFHRRLIADSPRWLRPAPHGAGLRPGGAALLAMEVGAGQAGAVAAVMRRDGRYADVELVKDTGGMDRVVVGRPKGRTV